MNARETFSLINLVTRGIQGGLTFRSRLGLFPCHFRVRIAAALDSLAKQTLRALLNTMGLDDAKMEIRDLDKFKGLHDP